MQPCVLVIMRVAGVGVGSSFQSPGEHRAVPVLRRHKYQLRRVHGGVVNGTRSPTDVVPPNPTVIIRVLFEVNSRV